MKYIFSFIIIVFMANNLNAQNKIAFEVSFSEPQTHYADVEMEISELKSAYIDLKMPVWTPGSYLIREFAKNVESFRAFNASGAELPAEKINKNTWRVSSGNTGRIKVRYRVYAFEISVRTSFVDESHAFLSPAGIFMYPDGQLNASSEVSIKPYKTWTKISTGLEKLASKANTFIASDFDILYDSPIEVGNQDVFEFDAEGARHEVAMYGGGNYDKEVLKRDMAKIVAEQTKTFGVNPNKRYVFIVHNFNSGGGGLEHLNSTVLGASRNSYNTEAGLLRFLGLVSHEYFHLWNVKRLRPIALGPFNYDQENYTSNLWIAEGFTAYYQDIYTKRAGLQSAEHYLMNLAGTISSVENQPGNRVDPVSQASFDAWIKQYRPNENSANSTISYYSKGALIGLIMDLEIINSTKTKAGLDEVMKAMYDEYYTKKGRGYTDAEFRSMLEKVSGKSFEDVYRDYVNGVKTIDYNKYFAYAGLTLIDDAAVGKDAYLGAVTALKDGKIVVTNVSRQSPAWNAGLNVNDEILSMDNYRINNVSDPRLSEVDKFISGKKTGDKVNITVNRDGLIRDIEVILVRNPNHKFRIASLPNPTEAQLAVRKRWLRL
ncbi:PDZ domain-containing protein [Daejeonella sp. H1SJ63]|jgi:predicted metalloprotease with PDZ domain|uniref:M61 family metallopeptidase n=1 Tax=Daejeonella sp. H1SJ63 TaxID=3034145 RepID=UPI0023ECCEFB|nr:PDZ domain-containing protein [Daejeonella sp. H1SJ63]